jgi:hypothetical protein
MNRGGRYVADKPGDVPRRVDPKSDEYSRYHSEEAVAEAQAKMKASRPHNAIVPEAEQPAAAAPAPAPAADAAAVKPAAAPAQSDNGSSDPDGGNV